VVAVTSGDLVDSRGAEKGVSQTRFTRTLRSLPLYVKGRIYMVQLKLHWNVPVPSQVVY
jgi:hypothetical protein